MPSETFLEQICTDDLMSAKVFSTGHRPTILLGLSIPEADRVICLVWALPEEDTEINMRMQVIYLNADARENRYKNEDVR